MLQLRTKRLPPMLALGVFAIALAASCSAMEVQAVSFAVDDDVYTAPQNLIEVEPGRRLNIYCVGAGSPTVILEAGLTDPTNVWSLVQPRLARQTRVCSYDRAGIGFSDEQTRASTSENIVDDLRKLLAGAGIEPPLLLVGASSGGMHVRLYTYTYPDEVVGLVLVDPSHEDQTEGFRGLDPMKRSAAEWDKQVLQPSLARRVECIALAKQEILPGSDQSKQCGFPQYPQLSVKIQLATEKFQLSRKFQRAQLSEEETVFHDSADQLRNARRHVERLPVIVLTKDRPPSPEKPLTVEEANLREARYQLWVSLGRQSAAMSLRGVQRIVPGAGHGMPLENPEVVAETVLELLASSSAHSE